METAGVIERIWRYPVKSTGGELLDAVELDGRGLVGDRLWAVRDHEGKLGSGKNGSKFRRMPGLRSLAGRTNPGGAPTLLGPGGEPVADPESFLREFTGRDVSFARETGTAHHDSMPVSVLTTATLDWMRAQHPDVAIDERRFRPNLLVRTPPGTAPFIEETWVGRTVRFGEPGDGGAHIVVDQPCGRCTMVNDADHDLPATDRVLRTIAKQNANALMVLCTVAAPGSARVGDAVVVEV